MSTKVPRLIGSTATTLMARARLVRVGWMVVGILSGAVLALVLATVLGAIGDISTAAAVAFLCLTVVLFAIALWDLIVRWSGWNLPQFIGPGPMRSIPGLALVASPWLMLLAGVAFGRFVWR